jgi:hypothetical protein
MKFQRTFEWLAAVACLVCIADLLFVAIASQRPALYGVTQWQEPPDWTTYFCEDCRVRDFFGLLWWIAPSILFVIAVSSFCLSRRLRHDNAA